MLTLISKFGKKDYQMLSQVLFRTRTWRASLTILNKQNTMISTTLSFAELLHILDFSCDGIFIYDATLKLVYANSAARDGCNLDVTALGKDWRELKRYGYFYATAALDAFTQKKAFSSEFITREGRHMLCTATPLLNADGEVDFIISNVRFLEDIASIRQQLVDRTAAAHINERDFIASSPQMIHIISMLEKIAQTDISIILRGETGVGKSFLAKHIHTRSLRAESRFVAVNCAAVPPSLCEAEFFGYEKGAFTGADKIKKGLFESADNGTLFLDEIGELPRFIQVKLLRVLQEGKVKRLGSTHEIPVNVRVIAATNKNIKEMTSSGRFRADLFHRLNGLEVIIPPLRERPEDVRLLVSYFLHKYNIKYSTSKIISLELQDRLEHYAWPGNVRELSYAIERLVVLSQSHCIETQLFGEGGTAAEEELEKDLPTLRAAVDATEKKLLEKAKHQYGTTRAMAAALGVSHVTVAKKMRRYRIR